MGLSRVYNRVFHGENTCNFGYNGEIMGILYYQDNIRMSLNIGYTLNNNFNGEHDDKPSRVGAPNVQTCSNEAIRELQPIQVDSSKLEWKV